MTIHAVADSSGFYLCQDERDAHELCQTDKTYKHYGGKTMVGWLFSITAALNILQSFDRVVVYVRVAPEKVVYLGINEFADIWRKVNNVEM